MSRDRKGPPSALLVVAAVLMLAALLSYLVGDAAQNRRRHEASARDREELRRQNEASRMDREGLRAQNLRLLEFIDRTKAEADAVRDAQAKTTETLRRIEARLSGTPKAN